MNIVRRAVVVIDPIGSARQYGPEIANLGFLAISVVSGASYAPGLERLHSNAGFDVVFTGSCLSDLMRSLDEYHVCAVVPGSDTGLTLADRLASLFSLIGNPASTSTARVNKLAMKERLLKQGVRATPSYPLTLESSGVNLPSPFPLVVKPTMGTGSRGVKLCNNSDEMLEALRYMYSGEQSPEAIIERYLDGDEYFVVTANLGPSASKQLLCFAQYEKLKITNNPSVYRNIRSLPVDTPMAAQAFKYADEINCSIGALYGVNDIEMKYEDGEFLIVEQNGRLPGANVPKLIEACTGVNCYELNLNIYLGEALQSVPDFAYTKQFCVCCLVSDIEGLCDDVEGLDEVQGLSSFCGCDLLVTRGDTVERTHDFLSAWGFVYLVHSDSEALARDSELVHSLMKLKLKAHAS